MKDKQSTTKGLAILSAAGIAVKLLSVLYVPMLVRTIGEEAYGVYNNTYVIFTWVYAMTNVGMQPAIAKLVAELEEAGNPKDALKAFKISRTLLALVGLVAMLSLIIFAKPISIATRNPRATLSLMALAPTIAFTSILVSYRGYFQGRSLITPIGISQVVEQIVNVALSLLCAYLLLSVSFEAGVAGATVGTSIGALIALVYIMYIYRSKRYYVIPKSEQLAERRHSTKYLLRKVIKYGMPITISTGLANFGAVIDATNVRSRLQAIGYAQKNVDLMAGILGKYQTLINVPIVFTTAIGTIMLPAIARSVVNRDKVAIRDKTRLALKLGFVITIPSAMGLTVLSESVYKALYGINTPGHMLMTYGAFITVLIGMIQIQTTVLQSLNRFYACLWTLVIGLVVKIGINYILIGIPSINIYGAIIGGYVGYGITFLLNVMLLKKSIKKKIGYFSMLIGPVAASLLMGVVIYYVNKYGLYILGGMGASSKVYVLITFIAVIIGVAVYGYGLILTGVITKKEIKEVSPRLYGKIPGFIRRRMR